VTGTLGPQFVGQEEMSGTFRGTRPRGETRTKKMTGKVWGSKSGREGDECDTQKCTGGVAGATKGWKLAPGRPE